MSVKRLQVIGTEGHQPFLGLFRWGAKWGVYWCGLGVRFHFGPLFLAKIERNR